MPADAEEPTDPARLLDDLLQMIQRRTGFALVMVTRRVGDDWRISRVTANPYGVSAGETLRWSDSICSRVVASGEEGPWLVADVADSPLGQAPVTQRVAIGSYAGAAVTDHHGALLGTLCAIDPERGRLGEIDLFEFAASFASWSMADAVDRVRSARAAERRLFRGDGTGATVVPASSWSRALTVELEHGRWTGQRLAVALFRRDETGRGRAGDAVSLAEELRAGLDPDDLLSVTGSNRVAALLVGGEADDRAAELERLCGASVAWVAIEATGKDLGDGVVDELEHRLVGSAAAARAASKLLTYDFCAACGRKGVYRRAGTAMQRCKYCGDRLAVAT